VLKLVRGIVENILFSSLRGAFGDEICSRHIFILLVLSLTPAGLRENVLPAHFSNPLGASPSGSAYLNNYRYRGYGELLCKGLLKTSCFHRFAAPSATKFVPDKFFEPARILALWLGIFK